MTRNSRTLPYDILADWLINKYCNYSCDYCPQANTNDHRKSLAGQMDIETITDFFDTTGLTWLIHMSGGEPFLHPDFISLCRRLTEKHYISINSNVSLNTVDVFAENIDPERVAFIHASLHYEELKNRHSIPGFLRAINTLETAGFNTYVTQVFYPPLIKEFSQISSYFHQNNIIVHPKTFRGFYDGRLYPQEYSENERNIFIESARRASSLVVIPYTHINPDYDLQSLQGFLSFKGSQCLAGNQYVQIDYKGNIYRCSMAGSPIGNIFNGTFNRFSGAEICPYRICSCSYYGLEYAKDEPRVVKISSGKKRLIKLKKDISAILNRLF
jgi:MoaA/NifB/PqqE/SkfB family radical SAM enzyme